MDALLSFVAVAAGAHLDAFSLLGRKLTLTRRHGMGRRTFVLSPHNHHVDKLQLKGTAYII